MEITHRRTNGICLVTLEGMIALDGLSIVKKHLGSLIEDRTIQAIAINFENVSLIDSKGIGFIVTLYRKLLEQQRKLVLYQMKRNARDIFEMLAMDKMISIYTTEAEALAALKE